MSISTNSKRDIKSYISAKKKGRIRSSRLAAVSGLKEKVILRVAPLTGRNALVERRSITAETEKEKG